MTRDEARHNIDARFAGKTSIGIYDMIDAIYDDVDSRICKNCKWYLDEVCVNDESPLCADFVSETYGCVYLEREINEIG